MKARKILTTEYLTLLTAVFMFFVSFFAIVPIISLYAEILGAGELMIGVIVGIFAFSAVLSRIPFGRYADNVARKPLLIIGALIFIISPILYTLTESLLTLALIRILHGVGIGGFSVASMSMAVDMVPKKRLGEAMGLFGVPVMLGMILGPGIAGFLVDLTGYNEAFYIASMFAVISLILVLMVTESDIDGTTTATFIDVLKDSNVTSAVIGVLALTTAYGAVTAFFPVYANRLGYTEFTIGLFFTIYAAAALIVRVPVGRYADKKGISLLTAPMMVVSVIGITIIGITTNETGFYIAGIVFGIGFGAAYTTLLALSVETVNPLERGKASALINSSFDMGIAIGSIALGAIASAYQFDTFFLITATILLIGTIGFILAKKTLPNT
ncbi:MFS family permease [Methanonatronarchaeum thermophilum]|uniref:MFS family permease n=1 Tax=Methanonatronarchaeum thermophilum TaxID=1927129 RepID=A0A1Y3GID6_9EURY|nr:MFS transporter [Methanonatronarchaeum thermophilum]OUJ19195.1 MFS family permease [Methanonatronarchaeum thermophilum]